MKARGLVAVGFGSNQFAFAGEAQKIGATSAEESSGQPAEREDELARIITLKSRAGKLEEKPLERLLRMRLARGTGISLAGCQSAPSASI
jgi:hypothetical protein